MKDLSEYEALATDVKEMVADGATFIGPNRANDLADDVLDLIKRVREAEERIVAAAKWLGCASDGQDIEVFARRTVDAMDIAEAENAKLRARVEIQDEAIKAARAVLPVKQNPPTALERICNLAHGLLDVESELATLSPSEADSEKEAGGV